MKNGIRLLLLGVMVILSARVAAQDTLTLKNGDKLNGEIKSLNKSVLTIETDYSDSDFKVEWEHVAAINSIRKYNIFLSSKEKFYASFSDSTATGFAFLEHDGIISKVKLNEIVIIDPIKDSFVDRFNASISSGLTLTKANNSKQFSSRATISYHTINWHLGGSFNDTRNEQDDVEPIRRTDGSVNFYYLLYKNWFGAVNYDFLSNTEQQIKLRGTQTLAIGNLIVRNNRLYLSGSAGVTFNRENYYNEAEILNTKEGFMGVEFNAYDIGDLNFLTKLSYYPSFTESNRNRVNFSVDFKYDFPLDFFIKLGYTLNFDSKPPNNGARQDYVFQTTLGWEF